MDNLPQDMLKLAREVKGADALFEKLFARLNDPRNDYFGIYEEIRETTERWEKAVAKGDKDAIKNWDPESIAEAVESERKWQVEKDAYRDIKNALDLADRKGPHETTAIALKSILDPSLSSRGRHVTDGYVLLSRLVFEERTGVKLPKSKRDVDALIDEMFGAD